MTDPIVPGVRLAPTICAICGTYGNSAELYPPTYDAASFNERIFSARRLPDAIHYRLVRCLKCGLVRSDPAADQASLSGLYSRSSFDYASEVPNLRRTYGRYLARARAHSRGLSLLEIGCGNGFMLEEALAQGYEEVRGVEPSRKAIATAQPAVKDRIVLDVMRPGLFEPNEFDTVCMFQVFDHLPDPGALLDEVHAVLGPGGALLCFNHDAGSLSARMLGERSPIVDIEHCYLYTPMTMKLLLEQHGFDVLEGGAATNTLSLRHFLHLLPTPNALKATLTAVADATRAGGLRMRLPLGNLYAIGRRA
ncbi:MAG: class I SAM-dependent methyltransferase [Candidatus Dormibacteraceae bacterium]